MKSCTTRFALGLWWSFWFSRKFSASASSMFTYFARFHEKFDLPVYPVVLYSFDRPRRKQPGTYEVAFPRFIVNRFQFRVIQLNRLRWRDYLSQPNPAATALMAKMQIAGRDRVRVKLQCLRLIATLKLDPARSQLIAGFVHSYLRLSAQEQPFFERELGTLPQEEKQEMITLTNEWIEEGIVKGEAVGEAKGERGVILRLGTKRFGEPDAIVRAALEAADLPRLEVLVDRLLEVESWQELLAD
jgi:hypothetical protein